MAEVKYPNITVPLSDEDGNAFSIIGRACEIARHAGVPADEIKEFTEEAMSGNYKNLLQTVIKWFETT